MIVERVSKVVASFDASKSGLNKRFAFPLFSPGRDSSFPASFFDDLVGSGVKFRQGILGVDQHGLPVRPGATVADLGCFVNVTCCEI